MYSHELELRQEIVKIGRLMYDKGLILASDGNISARLGHGRILLTPSGLHKGMLEPDQLIIVNEAGKKVGGPRHLHPTSELPMHLEAYRQRPDVTAVVHAHPPYAVALSIAGISMADCLLPEAVVFLGTIPTTAYATPSSAENAQVVRELIGQHDGLVLQRHGSLTVGHSPMQAFMRLETLERHAFIAYLLATLGVHNPMPPADVQKLLLIRQQLGLSRPGEAEMFCEQCGVCHPEGAHLNQRRFANVG
ncbi:MAG TPA: class II aldolase/adducin family protein [Chloroflexota bacterium]|nr:class II aldolase/adducin family protein [Chloroflexota bacterium]